MCTRHRPTEGADSAPTERHAFRAGSASYGQSEDQCFYCWEPEDVHEEPDLELHGLLP